MSFSIEDLGAVKKKLSVEIPRETVQAELEKSLKDLGKKARIKGFRPGKAPKNIIKKMFWPQIEQEVSQNLVEEALPPILEEVGKKMVSQPVLRESEFAEGEPFKFSVVFEVKPEFDIDGYKGLELRQEEFKVEEEQVDKKMEEIRQAYASVKTLEEDRPLKKGDLAVVDYKGYVGDEALEGAANPSFQMEVGAGHFHVGFEAALIGLGKGETAEINATFDDKHYNPKLAGREVRFEVKVVDVKVKVLPELNDEFAKDLGQGVETLDGLRAMVRADMEKNGARRVRDKVDKMARDKLLELVELEAPDTLIGQELDSMVQNTKFNLRRSGIDLEAMGISENKIRDDYRDEAQKRVKAALIFEKIAEKESIEIKDEDVEGEVVKAAAETGQPVDVVREIYKKNNWLDSLKDQLLLDRALNFVVESAKIEIVAPGTEEEPEQAPEA
ncbi:MAG: trigger factor [Pseudomonadota bacterium]